MKWFDNWFRKKIEKVYGVDSRDSQLKQHTGYPIRSNELSSKGMNFTIYNGVGGYAVEIRNFNAKIDMHEVTLHIVPSDKDLGESLTQIITYELLKQ